MLTTDHKFNTVVRLAEQVTLTPEKVQFHNIFANDNGGVALLGLKAGQALAPHQAAAEAMIFLLEGQVMINAGGVPHTLHTGEFLLLGSAVTHSVEARSDSKILLVKIKSDK